MDATTRVNWSITGRAKAIAEAAGADGGRPGREGQGGVSMSAYVSTVLEQRAAQWQAALEYLADQGWSRPQIRRICKEIPAPPSFSLRPAAVVAQVVEMSTTEARAILVLARELAAGNAEVERRL